MTAGTQCWGLRGCSACALQLLYSGLEAQIVLHIAYSSCVMLLDAYLIPCKYEQLSAKGRLDEEIVRIFNTVGQELPNGDHQPVGAMQAALSCSSGISS